MASKKVTKKIAPPKAASRKPAARTAAARKPAPKKTAARKPLAKKAAAPKKAVARKPAARPATAKPAKRPLNGGKAAAPAKVVAIRAAAAKAAAKPAGKLSPTKAAESKILVKAPESPVFGPGDHVVYPTHGVGKVLDVETATIADHTMRLFVIHFERDRMTLRVPVEKAATSGLRRLSSRKIMETALTTLKGRARVKRTMWSRRAQEYEAKINSGDPISIAEVVRDLFRNVGQPDQSYSERQIYEAARDRLACELAAIEKIDKDAATEKLEGLLKAA
jgi:CarD family transcriptional regulator